MDLQQFIDPGGTPGGPGQQVQRVLGGIYHTQGRDDPVQRATRHLTGPRKAGQTIAADRPH